MTNYSAVLVERYADKKWRLVGDDYSGLTWQDESPKPTKKTLDDAWPAVRDARAWDAVRLERDRLLAASDWTQVADAPVDQQAWAVYRQALRDMPQDFATPNDVVWPEVP